MTTCSVPKDLSNIKTKIALGLTKRQLICFGCAGAAGFPFYYFGRQVIGVQAASLVMVGLMLPFFFFAMYEKDGFPAEKVLYFMVRQKFLTPGIRPYRSENVYRKLAQEEQVREEARRFEKESDSEAEAVRLKEVSGRYR